MPADSAVPDAAPATEKKLTAKARRFVEEYLVDFCATQAALRAGYSPRSARSIGAENLTKPHICAAIAATVEKLKAKAEKTAEDVQAELERLAFANMLDYMRVDDFSGDPRIDFSALTREKASAIRKLTVESFLERDPDGEDGAMRQVKRVKFELHDKRRALIDLMQQFHHYEEAGDRADHAVNRSKKQLRADAAKQAGAGKFAPPPPPSSTAVN
jgi:phage terminase small subunit